MIIPAAIIVSNPANSLICPVYDKSHALLKNLDAIRNADQASLERLYREFRGEFTSWIMRHYSADEDMAGEVYQQAFIALYYNIRDGKITQLNSSVKTYLFAIGKNIAREQWRHRTRFVPEEDRTEVPAYDPSEYSIENNERKDALKLLLNSMGDPCKTVLQLFYFENFSMEAIAQRMEYKTEQIASKRKFICLQQIRKMLHESGHLTTDLL